MNTKLAWVCVGVLSMCMVGCGDGGKRGHVNYGSYDHGRYDRYDRGPDVVVVHSERTSQPAGVMVVRETYNRGPVFVTSGGGPGYGKPGPGMGRPGPGRPGSVMDRPGSGKPGQGQTMGRPGQGSAGRPGDHRNTPPRGR